MEKSNGKFLVLLLISALMQTPALAAEEGIPADTPAVEAVSSAARVRTPEEEKKIKEMRKRSAEKRKDLNGSSWEVSFIASSNAKLKGKKDKFIFQDGQFMSEAFTKRGFSRTNYTITVPPDETSPVGVWETMQTGKEGQIFIRGEWEGERMSGHITEQLDGGKKVFEHSFTTQSRKAIPASTKETDKKALETAPSEGALVSKEEGPAVAAFEPGTTEEAQ